MPRKKKTEGRQRLKKKVQFSKSMAYFLKKIYVVARNREGTGWLDLAIDNSIYFDKKFKYDPFHQSS